MASGDFLDGEAQAADLWQFKLAGDPEQDPILQRAAEFLATPLQRFRMRVHLVKAGNLSVKPFVAFHDFVAGAAQRGAKVFSKHDAR